eukprot:12193654-Alexandrium_andersonii.AAC.1
MSGLRPPDAGAIKPNGWLVACRATSRRLDRTIRFYPNRLILPQRRARHRVIFAPVQGWASRARRRPPKE